MLISWDFLKISLRSHQPSISLGRCTSLLYITITLLLELSTRNHSSESSLTKSEEKTMSQHLHYPSFKNSSTNIWSNKGKGKKKYWKQRRNHNSKKINNKGKGKKMKHYLIYKMNDTKFPSSMPSTYCSRKFHWRMTKKSTQKLDEGCRNEKIE